MWAQVTNLFLFSLPQVSESNVPVESIELRANARDAPCLAIRSIIDELLRTLPWDVGCYSGNPFQGI